jgi:hypothetical protein
MESAHQDKTTGAALSLRGSDFGVRRPVGALVAGDLSPAASPQVATDKSGDSSSHSKKKF